MDSSLTEPELTKIRPVFIKQNISKNSININSQILGTWELFMVEGGVKMTIYCGCIYSFCRLLCYVSMHTGRFCNCKVFRSLQGCITSRTSPSAIEARPILLSIQLTNIRHSKVSCGRRCEDDLPLHTSYNSFYKLTKILSLEITIFT